ncbi:TonB-dependent receptor plug domain-containing protein [Lysobacter humi (ex Lee et al. 2017)]
MPITPRRARLALALLPLLAFAAAAQEPPAAAPAAQTYLPDAFARYAPKTALDMLRQVPGFVIREAVEERGLGQATGNVLINGQRISGKSNDVIGELGRIPAANVLRIEIVDGATLDVPGLSGQVANVVAKATGLSGQWAWRPEFRSYYTSPLLTRGEVSVSGARGGLDWTVGLSNGSSRSGAGGPTWISNADGSFRELRDDVWAGEYEAPRLSGRLTHKAGDGDVGNLSASYQTVDYDYLEDGRRTGPGLPDRRREVIVTEGGYSHEVGGDYEFGLGGGRLKLIGLHRVQHTPFGQTAITRFDDGLTAATGSRFEQVSDERERIARAEYRWKALGGDWQLSGEGAFNSLEQASEFATLAADGTFVPVDLANANATVKEDRFEAMASHGRALTSTATLQVAAGAEHSWLRQAGAGGLSRRFLRPKGSASLAWKATPDLDVNVKLQRRVGQLNFGDFLASVNLTDDRANAGNPELVPQQSWELDVEATRRLGAWGSTTLRLYAHRIDDIVDIVPIGADGESPGNLDRATRHGIEWKSTLQLDPLGWRGAKLDLRYQAQDTDVTDPLTGEQRRISNSLIRLASLGLRHDVPGTDWAWGTNASHEYYAQDYRLTEVGRRWEGPVWASVFVEHKNVFGLTVRATAGNQLDAMSMWDRTVYVDRRDGPVDYFEKRDRRIGPIFSFSVSGKF